MNETSEKCVAADSLAPLWRTALILVVLVSGCARYEGLSRWPSSPLAFSEAAPLMEAGLCKTHAEYLEQSGCDEWKTFLGAGRPSLPSRTFVVGLTFRVELTKSYQLLWSEHNPTYVVYNAGNTDDLQSLRLIRVNADNDEEERETASYLRSLYGGQADRGSRFHAYLEADVVKPYRTYAFTDRGSEGCVARLGPRDVAYLRQAGAKTYLFVSSFHRNAYEPDSHPVLYFAILADPRNSVPAQRAAPTMRGPVHLDDLKGLMQ